MLLRPLWGLLQNNSSHLFSVKRTLWQTKPLVFASMEGRKGTKRMLACSDFYDILTRCNITFFTGVPDSLLKDICAYITDHTGSDRHIITANEGNAGALAAGYYLSTGYPGLVYMQNSGLGNAVNPLTSLADPDGYRIPLLMLIGWRGEPGTKDEPQHA